jgi:hypothetical protein
VRAQQIYLAAAIVGAVVPYAFFVAFIADDGLDLVGFVEAAFANGAAGGFAADLLISSAVFWTFMLSRRDGPAAWPFMLVNLLVGLSCALPLYLWASSRKRAEVAAGLTRA